MDSHSLPSWVAKILTRLKNWWSLSGVDWSLCRDILVALANGGLNVSFIILCGPKSAILSNGFSFVAVV